MSIDARIAAVTVVAPLACSACKATGKAENGWDDCPVCHGGTRENPVVRLKLEPREPGGLAGQPTLTLVDPPSTSAEFLRGLVGTEIWGGSSEIMVGETKWAERIGYTRIRLVEARGR